MLWPLKSSKHRFKHTKNAPAYRNPLSARNLEKMSDYLIAMMLFLAGSLVSLATKQSAT
jgi:hypothetical protein